MTSPLRLGFVCFSSYGGSGVVATELARGMAVRGHQVHLITGDTPHRLAQNGVPVQVHAVQAADYPLFERPLYGMAIAAKIVEVAEQHGLDVLHVHYAVPHATSAFLARQVLGPRSPRVISTLHGTDVTHVGQQSSVRSINRFSILASDGITVPSAFLRDTARAALDLPADRSIEIIENFVNTEQFAPADAPDRSSFDPLFPSGADAGAPVLIHVSNFRPVKRVPEIVDVLARVRATTPARLVLIGDGPDRPAVEARAQALGVASSVAMLGPQREPSRYLKHADVFVLPSEAESFGLAALEAASCGVPVAAYRVGGLAEVIKDQETGVLVSPPDLDGLSGSVLGLLRDDARRRRMGAAARAHVLERFGREPALDRYEHYYHRVNQ